MNEIKKIENLLHMIVSEYGFIEVDGKYVSKTKYDLTQIVTINWDTNKKRYELSFDVYKGDERITGFNVYNKCFLPMKKHLFDAIII